MSTPKLSVSSFFVVLWAMTLGASVALAQSEPDVCNKGSYGRGAGTIPNGCPAGSEKNGALCYPLCAAGYQGVGPVCWERCPSGYTDDGAFCRRDVSIIGANTSSCPIYNKCGLGSSCSKCPAGYKNDGCTCRRDAHIFAKKSYGRGVGTPMVCSSGMQNDAGLCYQSCQAGYAGVGPVCWGQCPADFPTNCGTFCATTQAECARYPLQGNPNVIPPPCTETPSATACNGAAALCGRRYDAVTFAATHNAHAVLGHALGTNAFFPGIPGVDNQSKNIRSQLRDGVRGLMIDVHKVNGQVHMCHGSNCLQDYGTFASGLRSIRRFLDANPTETVTIMLEHAGDVSIKEVADVIRQMKMTSYLYYKADCGGDWPTLTELGKRLLVFTQKSADSTEPMIMAYWDHAFENPYSFQTLDDFQDEGSCDHDRGHEPGLFVMNHFLTPVAAAPIGTGHLANGQRLRTHVNKCANKHGRYPNFIAVDWYNEGSLLSVVQEVNNTRAMDTAHSKCEDNGNNSTNDADNNDIDTPPIPPGDADQDQDPQDPSHDPDAQDLPSTPQDEQQSETQDAPQAGQNPSDPQDTDDERDEPSPPAASPIDPEIAESEEGGCSVSRRGGGGGLPWVVLVGLVLGWRHRKPRAR